MSHDKVSQAQQGFDAILLAAGSGKRFQSEKPKQYTRLAGKTVLEHSLKTLLSLPHLQRLLLVLSPDDTDFAALNIQHPKVTLVSGGQERAHSVLEGLHYLDALNDPTSWVLVHDAARCAVRAAAIQKLMTACLSANKGGLLVAPVVDTIKKHTQTGVSTVDRRELFIAQTPEFFPRQLLQRAYEQALANGQVPTDESSAMEIAGHTDMLLVEGDPDNIKVTSPADRFIVEKILELRT